MASVSMTVNGKAVSKEIEGRTLLVDLLRTQLNLTGTHVGCDTSQCGACVVHVDGEAVKACTVFAAELEGGEWDVELAVGVRLYRPGIEGAGMSAAALLKENPKPTEQEVRDYLEGNICRCTGYHNIVKAIMAASGQDVPAVAAE